MPTSPLRVLRPRARLSLSVGLAVAVAVVVAAVSTAASPDRDATFNAWVFFADKAVAPGPEQEAALAAVAASYNTRAIARRRLRRTAPGLFDAHDLPVPDRYVDAVVARATRHRVTSRWLNAVSVTVTHTQAGAIAALPFVRVVEPVRRRADRLPARSDVAREDAPSGGTARSPGFYGFAGDQIAQIEVSTLHDQGFTGAGVVIGVLDTGFRKSHAAFSNPDHPLLITAEWDFVDDDGDTGIEAGDHPDQHFHGSFILGILAAYKPGTYVGAAYDASFILAKCEDVRIEDPTEEDLFVAGLEFIEANGGDVATSSVVLYNYYAQEQLDGLTSVMTIGFNVATKNGVHCCQGAGNEGHDNDPETSHLLPPADAFQVITCGAVDLNDTIAGFSSDGPTADGRTKPEALARGVSTWSVDPYTESGYTTASGTSAATPLVAGAVACIVQARHAWTVDRMRDELFTHADYFRVNGTFDPLHVLGYGIIDAAATVPCPADLDESGDVDFGDVLAVLGAWGEPGGPADLDGDGVVGFSDLLIILGAWASCA